MLIDTPDLIQWTDPADAAFTVIGVEAGTNHTTIGSFGTAIRLLKPLDLSAWLTAQRPALDAGGHVIGFASDTGRLELWDGVQWSQVLTSINNGIGYTPVNKAGDTMIGALAMGANLLSGSNVSFTGGTLTGLTHSGGTISGSVAGAPTLSGSWNFQATTVVGSNTTGQTLRLNGAAGSVPVLEFANAGVKQFHYQPDGSFNLQGFTYDATGSSAFQWMKVLKQTGDVTFSGPFTANGSQITLSPTSPVLSGTAPVFVNTKVDSLTGSFTNNPYVFQTSVGADTASTANGARLAIGLANYSYKYGGTGHEGGRTGLTVSLTQMGVTDANNGDGSYTPGRWWLDHFYPSGGTSTASVGGFAYGGNWKPVLHQGAQFYGVYNGLGEVDMSIEGSTRLVTVGGTVTAGDTLSLTFTSTSITGSPLTVSAVAVAGDTATKLAAKLHAAVMNNDALNAAQVGASYGSTGSGTFPYSTPTLASLMLVYAHWIGLTVSSSVGGAATETITIGSETAGASSNNKYGLTFVKMDGDGVRGILPGSSLIGIGNGFYSPASSGFEYIIGINTGGGGGSTWPLTPNSTFIGFRSQINNTSVNAGTPVAVQTPRMFSFVDFRGVNFTLSNGRPLLFPNFHLDGTGKVRVGAGTITPASTGLTIDAQGYFGSAVALSSGGTGTATTTYFIGDVGYDAFDGQYQVTAVNGSGVVTAFSVLVNPTAPSGSVPSTVQSVSGGSGQGWRVSVTWTAGSLVSVGSSAVGVVIGTGSAGATTDTGGHLLIPFCAGTPTGVPTNAAAGIALRYDTTNHKLWAYDNAASAWKGVALT